MTKKTLILLKFTISLFTQSFPVYHAPTFPITHNTSTLCIFYLILSVYSHHLIHWTLCLELELHLITKSIASVIYIKLSPRSQSPEDPFPKYPPTNPGQRSAKIWWSTIHLLEPSSKPMTRLIPFVIILFDLYENFFKYLPSDY